MPAPLALIGQRFGKLYVIEQAPNRGGKTFWVCRCDCGQTKNVRGVNLRRRSTISCGCGTHQDEKHGVANNSTARRPSNKLSDAKYYAANRRKILEQKHEYYLKQRESPEFKAKQAVQGKAYRQENPGYLKAYQAANREKLKKKAHERYLQQRDEPEFKAKKAELRKAYLEANQAKLSEKRKADHAKNRDRDNTKNRAWYAAHRELRSAQIKDYAAQHAEDAKTRSDEWYSNNRPRKYAKQRAWVAANPEATRAYQQKRYALVKKAPGSFDGADISRIYEEQKGCCHYCTVYLGKRYEIDHYIPVTRNGTHYPNNIVLACMPCNRSKGNKMPDDFIQSRARRASKGLSLSSSSPGVVAPTFDSAIDKLDPQQLKRRKSRWRGKGKA